MTEEEITAEAVSSMMEHGIVSPRRTDLAWKIKTFMVQFGIGDRSPNDLLQALKEAGLELGHSQTTGQRT